MENASDAPEGNDASAGGPNDSWEARFKGLSAAFGKRQNELETTRAERDRLATELEEARALSAAYEAVVEPEPEPRIEANNPRKPSGYLPSNPAGQKSIAQLEAELKNEPWITPYSGFGATR